MPSRADPRGHTWLARGWHRLGVGRGCISAPFLLQLTLHAQHSCVLSPSVPGGVVPASCSQSLGSSPPLSLLTHTCFLERSLLANASSRNNLLFAATLTNTDNNAQNWGGPGIAGAFTHCWWECGLVQAPCKTICLPTHI